MPLLTRASAADLTRSSVTLQANRFQLFQPMGGVSATPFSRAREDRAQKRNPKNDSARQLIILLAKRSMTPSRRMHIFVSRRNDKTTRVRLERKARA